MRPLRVLYLGLVGHPGQVLAYAPFHLTRNGEPVPVVVTACGLTAVVPALGPLPAFGADPPVRAVEPEDAPGPPAR